MDLNGKPKTKSGNTPSKQSHTREDILKAALRTFARDGFAGASIPQIAKAAKVAPPLVYYYFGSKDQLWRDTVDYSMRDILRETKAIRNATRSLPPLDRLRAIIHAFTAFAAHSPDYVIMVISQARSDSDRFAWAQENYSNPLLDENIQILNEARALGLLKDVPLEHLAFLLFGGILTYFAVTPDLPEGEALEGLIERHAAMVFKIFVDGYVLPE